MFDVTIIGPILTLLVSADLLLHIYLDYRKIRTQSSRLIQDTPETVPKYALFTAAGATILSFILVLILCSAWLFNIDITSLSFIGLFCSPPDIIWQIGFALLSVGILLHGWSRFTRHEMASSWEMSDTHRLVKSGPYRKIRHPSYVSYFLCFIGLVIMIPSLLTLILLLGIPGYHNVAKAEERLLITHFGEEYVSYMKKTGMFFPKLKINEN